LHQIGSQSGRSVHPEAQVEKFCRTVKPYPSRLIAHGRKMRYPYCRVRQISCGRLGMISVKRVIATTLFPKHLSFLDKLNRTPLFVDFVKANRHVKSHATREQMYDDLMRTCLGPIDYLEFGVFEGKSILYWANKKREPEGRFVGFDTFTGLPEYWNKYFRKGHFNTEGKVPDTIDKRVSFVKGMYQDTLPGFLRTFSPKNRLVIHNDSDLYTSSLFLLTKLNDIMGSGTIIIFDEFGDVQHEFRAFFDYITSYRRRYRVVSAAWRYYTISVEML
jgi:O-methyltransferase